MRTFYLSLAVLALTFEASDAIGSSGLLRERNEQEHRQLSNGKSGTKGSKGKGKSSSAASPVCPDAVVSKSKGGKGGKGGKGKSKSDDTRFLEEVSRQLSKGKGKGKSSGGGDECCDYPTDLCEDETPEQVVCGQTIMEDTVLSTSLGCQLDMENPPTPPAVNAALIVDGATLECTGDGDNMIYSTSGRSSNAACVVLRNGATLKNCHIYNCPYGVVMEGMGNNRIVGSTFFGNQGDIATGTATMAPHDRSGMPNDGCYSVECSKFIGAAGLRSMEIRHNGSFILSNSDILGATSGGIEVWPDDGATVDIALEDVNIFGSIMSATTRAPAIQLGRPTVTTTGSIGEVGFYGTTKMVAHQYAIIQDSTGSGNTVANPVTVVVYGGIESYDTLEDAYQFADAAVMFEEDSTGLACTVGDLAFDFAAAAVPRFMDMGADFTCPAGSSTTVPTVCVGAGAGTCPMMPSIALTCSGSSGTSKSKGGKGGKSKGGKGGKSKTP